MTEHAIAIDDASGDPAICAEFVIEGLTNAEAKSAATGALVDHLLSKDNVDRAAEYADSLDDPFARDRLLIRVVGKCIDLNDDEYAMQIADAVEEAGQKAGAIETAALRLANRGDFEKALETAALLEHSSDTIAKIAVSQAARGMKDAAEETLKTVDYNKSRVFAMIEIATLELNDEKSESALSWFQKAGEAVETIEFEEDRIRALTELGNGFFDLGDKDTAAGYFVKAAALASELDNVHRDSFLVNAAIGILKSGDVESADDCLDKVVDKTQVAACLYGFSRVYEGEGETEDAVETIEEAYAMLKSQSEYEIRSTKARHEMFGAIAVQFQRVGLTQRAVEIAHENPDDGQRNLALTSIAQLLVMDGKPEDGDGVVKGIEPDSERVASFIGLSDAANTVKNEQLAVEYLRRAGEFLDEVEQMVARAEISDQISLRLNAYGATEGAKKFARDNLRLIAELRDEGGKAEALIRLASVFDKLGIEADEDDKRVLRTIARQVGW